MRKPVIFLGVLSIAFLGYLLIPWRSDVVEPAPESEATTSDALPFVEAQQSTEVRIAQVRSLNDEVSAADLEKILSYLSHTAHQQNGEQELLVLNEVMDRLRTVGLADKAYGQVLLGIIRNREGDAIVRDYAVQHAGEWLRDGRNHGLAVDIDEKSRDEIYASFGELLSEPLVHLQTAFGTTLNVLRMLHTDFPAEAENLLRAHTKIIREVASGEEGLLANRISALQTLPLLGDHERNLSVARSYAYSEAKNSPLKLAAISALGRMGTASDVQELQRIAAANDFYTQAAMAALQKIQPTDPDLK